MSARPSHLKVKADIPRNRLYFTISGSVTRSELTKLYTDVRFCVADLKPSFDVITDLSKCDLGMLSGVHTLRKIMNFLVCQKAGCVIRVINQSSLIYKQSLNFITRFQGYKVMYVASLAEAEEILESAVNRDGLRFYLHEHHVKYVYMGGQAQSARVIDMSVSGCAVQTASEPPEEGGEVVLTFDLSGQDGTEQRFELRARVVRVEDNIFAVTFTESDAQQRKSLMSCLACESQR